MYTMYFDNNSHLIITRGTASKLTKENIKTKVFQWKRIDMSLVLKVMLNLAQMTKAPIRT